jgi:hypothetical protein
MALNTWWDDDANQRYWMEITDREDLGGPLKSPKTAEGAWGYDLVSQVQPGDRVLHWWTRGGASRLAGWSEVADYATVVPEYTWQPRHGEPRTTTGWQAELGGLHLFAPPVASATLLPLLDEIVAVDDALSAAHKGSIYFPITRYVRTKPTPKTELRAAQAYFVKFPVELFDVIPGISSARIDGVLDPVDVDVPEDYKTPGRKAPKGRTARAQDPKLRSAIERRAVDVAKEYYLAECGGTDYVEVGKPYDIRVTVGGVARRCEVKGSSLEIDTVELTINEVAHSRTYEPVDLIVVDQIEPVRDAAGEVVSAVGGRRRVWSDWLAEDALLKATKFAYTLPD